MELNDKLKQLRKSKNLTQDELAKRLFINYKTISDYERGKSEPSLQILKIYADFFNISLDELADRDFNPIQDEFLFALYGETKDLSADEKQDILAIVQQAKKLLKKRSENVEL